MTTQQNISSVASSYRGRFAPSPSGALHFGSLIAAVASYLQAKSQQGEWWLRIDDIDPPRELPGAANDILFTLEQFGFEWDGEVQYQSHPQRQARYQQALQQLRHDGLLYPCDCSRKSLQQQTGQQAGYIVYPGVCRGKAFPASGIYASRLRVKDISIQLDDLIQGHCQWQLQQQIGDFILQRADGLFSYQLATGIDDAEQGMTEVVRGMDLLDSTPRQIYVQQQLGLSVPRYAHFPVAIDSNGQKLSKQNLATPIHSEQSILLLCKALAFLGQQPPAELQHTTLAELWSWSIGHWNISLVPGGSQQGISDRPYNHFTPGR